MDLGHFYRHPQMRDGRLNYCKECKKAEIKHNRSLKRGRYAEYERKRNQTEKRKAYHAANVSSRRGENPPKMAVQLARHRARKLNAEGVSLAMSSRRFARSTAMCTFAVAMEMFCSRPTP
jgi:hypothetical protein